MDAATARIFGVTQIIRKKDFAKNKILAHPEFLFARRIAIFRVPVLFSRRRGGDFAVGHHGNGHHRRDNGGAQRLRPAIFDILNWGLASGGDGLLPIIGGRVG